MALCIRVALPSGRTADVPLEREATLGDLKTAAQRQLQAGMRGHRAPGTKDATWCDMMIVCGVPIFWCGKATRCSRIHVIFLGLGMRRSMMPDDTKKAQRQ